jgi:hypothetical protein
VMINGKRNQTFSCGIVTTEAYIVNGQIRRGVEWIKEIKFDDLDLGFSKILHRDEMIADFTSLGHFIDRLIYPIHYKDNMFHVSIKVNQQKNIVWKQLVGLQSILMHPEHSDAIQLKVKVQSPGIIEFITDNKDAILYILNILKVMYQVSQYYKQSKEENLEKKYENLIMEHTNMIEMYKHFKIDELDLDIPVVE